MTPIRRIASTTYNNQDISAALNFHTYTVDADRLMFWRVFAPSVAGNGEYKIYATVQRLGAGAECLNGPPLYDILLVGEKARVWITHPVVVNDTDVVRLYVQGRVDDIAVTLIAEDWEDITCCTLGTGSVAYTYTMYQDVAETIPLPGVLVQVSTDIAGVNIIASATTNAFGQVTFYLDPGIYYFWSSLAGWSFTNPDTETVP